MSALFDSVSEAWYTSTCSEWVCAKFSKFYSGAGGRGLYEPMAHPAVEKKVERVRIFAIEKQAPEVPSPNGPLSNYLSISNFTNSEGVRDVASFSLAW